MSLIEKQILEHLLNRRKIGKNHILEDNLKHGFDRKDHGTIKTCLKELVKKGYVNKHPTQNGDAYALTYTKLEEILQLLYSS
jgi:predicted transcriptional regulator